MINSKFSFRPHLIKYMFEQTMLFNFVVDPFYKQIFHSNKNRFSYRKTLCSIFVSITECVCIYRITSFNIKNYKKVLQNKKYPLYNLDDIIIIRILLDETVE